MLELMASQHGCARRDQLLAAGLSDGAIRHRLARGLLTVVHPRVYQLGGAPLAEPGRWMAAVLYGGPGAALSKEAAAAAWGIGRRHYRGPTQVVRPGRRPARSGEVRVWRSESLRAADVTSLHGIPITTVTRTIIDLADDMQPFTLVNVMHEAQYLRRWNPTSLEREWRRHRHRRGAPTIRAALELLRSGSRGTNSHLEDRVVAAALEATDLQPLVNGDVPVLGGTLVVDICWPALRVCVEVDGPVHRLVRKRRNDAVREAALRAAGHRVYRLTHATIDRLGHDGVVAWFERTLERASRGAPATGPRTSGAVTGT